MPVSGGEPLIIVIIVAISLRWWVAWFGTCWSKGQSVSRKDLVPSVFLYSTTRSRSADLSPSTKAPCSRSRSSHGARIEASVGNRSEEHTSELQSRLHLVCRLLLEKKKTNITAKR